MRIIIYFFCLYFLFGCSQLKTISETSVSDSNVESQELDEQSLEAQKTKETQVADLKTEDSTQAIETKIKEVTPVQPKAILKKEKKQTPASQNKDMPPTKKEDTREPEPLKKELGSHSLFSSIKPGQAKDTQKIDLNAMGVIDVLDFPFDPIENELPEASNKGKDFSSYGFFTPDDKLEPLINEELGSLRSTSKSSTPHKNLLDRIRKNFKLDLTQDNPRINAQLAWYARNPDYLTRTFNRSSRYLYHVVSEVERRGLPMELALLPFVESAYNPFAYSHGRASGLWQFIPETGKIYGLEQDWWYDGRRDVLASTDAALNYLSHLHNLFEGNWLHALASYNSGSGRVSNAIKDNLGKSKKTDYWSLNLPKETEAYVPKLIALAKIVQNPKAYNIQFPLIADAPYFEKVSIGGQIDLAQAAKLAKVDISEIYQLNPGFNQWASSPLGPHHLLIPMGQSSLFKENLKQLPPEKRLNWHRYSVKPGDSLIKIAKEFNTTPMLIKEINNLKSNLIRSRQKLLIPIASQSTLYYNLSENNRLQTKQNKIQNKKETDKITYKVKSGDTIWVLARKHKVGVKELARWNGLAPTDPIFPGQKLVIWSNKPSITAAQSISASVYQKREMIQKVGYYVRKGDSLAKIANKFSVSIKDLISWNKLDIKKYLKPGQKLTIFVDITRS